MQDEIIILFKLVDINKLDDKLSSDVKREKDDNDKDDKLNDDNYEKMK